MKKWKHLKSPIKINTVLKVKDYNHKLKLHDIWSEFFVSNKLHDAIKIRVCNKNSIKYIYKEKELQIKNCFIKKFLEKISHIYPLVPKYEIIINKNIPIGSGLGGGSSNLATVAKYIAIKDGIGIKNLKEICHSISSDSVIFLSGLKSGIVYDYGKKVRKSSPRYKLEEIHLNEVNSSTKDVFKKLKEIRESGKLEPRKEINDLLQPALLINKNLREIFNQKLTLKNQNKILSISGSGSTIIVLKKTEKKTKNRMTQKH